MTQQCTVSFRILFIICFNLFMLCWIGIKGGIPQIGKLGEPEMS